MTAITLADLDTAKANVDFIAEVATSSALTIVNPIGQTTKTVAGAMFDLTAFSPRGAWSPSTAYALKDTVQEGGSTYVCLAANVSSGNFSADLAAGSWAVYQGLTNLQLAEPNATAGLGTQQSFAGAVARTQAAVNADHASIRDAGAIGDGVTDCWPALQRVASSGAAAVIRIPFVPDEANVYFFGTFTTAVLSGRTLDVDLGVVLSTPTNDITLLADTQLINFLRPTTFLQRALSLSQIVSPQGNKATSEKNLWVERPDHSFYSSVACNTSEIVARKAPWPTSQDAWLTDAFSATSASAFQFAVANDGYWHVGMRRVLPGDVMRASPGSISGAPKLVAMVRHTNGFSAVYCSADAVMTTLQFAEKVAGLTGTSNDIGFGPMRGTHSSYAGVDSVWSIRIDGWRRASIMFSGIVVNRFTTTGDIFEAGFGSYGDAAATVGWNDLVVHHNAPAAGGQLLRVKVFGDSTAQPRYDNYPTYLKEALEFSCGLRAVAVINQAIGGTNSAQQLAVMQSVGVSDADVVVIGIGTNDVQGLIPISTYRGNLQSMLALCGGRLVIFLDFGIWYTQAQAGARGQLSANYDQGGQYRSAMLRLAADNGIKVVDVSELSGPVLAHFVNSSLSPDLTAAGDTVVMDNIHPTAMLNRLTAKAIASAIVGKLFPKPTLRQVPVPLTATSAGWAVNAQPPFATVSADGTVTLDGICNDPGGATHTDGTVILTLPANLWPARTKRFRVAASGVTEYGMVLVDPTGRILIYGLAASVNVYLDGLVWNIDERPIAP